MTISSEIQIHRREQLRTLSSHQASHAGLWLDRYLPDSNHFETAQEQAEKLEKKQRLVKQVERMAISSLYAPFFIRWEETLTAFGAQCRLAKVRGRMVVGLGDESVLETSVALHHTYGVPYIPGSALKGLAARFARERLEEADWGHWEGEGERRTWVAGRAYRVIFGDTANAGYITFFDALLEVQASSPMPQALHPDVITVHHPDYYKSKEGAAPADWDSPTPVPFLSATGDYLVALSGPEPWVDATFDILGHALRELGVGAKTSSGYGRMELHPKLVDPIQSRVEDLRERIITLPVGRVTNDINKFYQEWRQLEAPLKLRQRIAQVILDKVAQADRVKASAEKPWYRELVACVVEDGGQ